MQYIIAKAIVKGSINPGFEI